MALFSIEPLVHYYQQTLTTLDLAYNQIGNQGAEHLANVLEQNQVTRVALFFFPFDHLFTILNRH